jgi:hypothetical protein
VTTAGEVDEDWVQPPKEKDEDRARTPKKATVGKKKCNKSLRERKINLTLKTDSDYHLMYNTCIYLRIGGPDLF